MPDFLLEIGAEEIPAGYIEDALLDLKKKLETALKERNISHKDVIGEATPRRLVIYIKDVPAEQPLVEKEVLGPPVKAAFDNDGKPTKAGDGFARKVGIPLDKLVPRESDGRLVAYIKEGGKSTKEVFAEILPGIIGQVAFPKTMRWVKGERFSFARPIRNIMAVFGKEVVEFEIAEIKAGRRSFGHHFLDEAWAEGFEVQNASMPEFCSELEKRHVYLEHKKRNEHIKAGIEKVAGKKVRIGAGYYNGADDIEDQHLLSEVLNLVEYPGIVKGHFPESYLELPDSVLKTAMKKHQRYFPVYKNDGSLSAEFISVTDRPEQYSNIIREGNERVLKARLSDALFFWKEDLKKALDTHIEGLKKVVFQEQLGSYYEKVERVGKLAQYIAGELKADKNHTDWIMRAARLMKADLLTHMVGEFPNLQGTMGMAYARAQNEPGEVPEAIAEHYQPRYANDAIPSTLSGKVLSLADKLDTIVGCFAIGLAPTGSRDPYALRRQSIGIIRIIVEGKLRLHLSKLVEKARAGYSDKFKTEDEKLFAEVKKFFGERIYNQLIDSGRSYDIVRAAMASGFDDIVDLDNRISAIEESSRKPEFAELVAAVERSKNIYSNVDLPCREVDVSLLQEKEEKDLWDVYQKKAPEISSLIDREDYVAASGVYLDAFGAAMHTFFEKVYVNVEDSALRDNRMLMLKAINQLYVERVADLAVIVDKK